MIRIKTTPCAPPPCRTCGGEGKVFVLRPKKLTHNLVPCPKCAVAPDVSGPVSTDVPSSEDDWQKALEEL